MSLLDDLRYWERRPEAWQELTRGDALYRELRQAVRAGTVREARQEVEACQNLIVDEEAKRRWNTARTLVWCAEQAATHPDFYRTEIDRVCFALADTPEFIQDETWAWICIRSLLHTPARRVEVPTALLHDEPDENAGFIATLALEVLDRGAAQIVHHPLDVFSTQTDDDFRATMQDAWTAATKLARKDNPELLCDGLWRLLEKDDQPVSVVSGRSAGGAAALGWYHVLRGTVPDERVIVLAEVDRDGVLTGVDGVSAKVRAIAADGRFDTIVVAGEENQREAEDNLRKLGKVDVTRIANLNTGPVRR